MDYAVVFCYILNGSEDDIIGVKVLEEHYNAHSVGESGALDSFFDGIDVGANVKFELYNVKYVGVKVTNTDSIMLRIKEDMEIMIESGELEYVSDYEMFASVDKWSEVEEELIGDEDFEEESSLIIL